ncbi:4'-phosphopantetheinyl transferase family protein [Spirosoma endophyticum]|uniref:4'-phosphopantetheinyl transferase superfamily protein n=1 Tax=Spirosoma endophyticum TaxID=662367 RepID=A0A1I1QZV5_9BACT|nr:4'-phosphopantetheinyl transferase superfamily protein [Spirosoma endophyticum]SFD27512.1 4'-phosphopantetheinyl transferase superfamily protein [Spirosoma endophyticum]
MIGNDIVDLAQAKQESNWRRAGFLDKVFTAHEQQLIHSANDPDCMVWLLWSMKESAYKLVNRQTGKRVFAPQKLVCHLESTGSETAVGTVFQERTYYTKSVITNQYVATVAFTVADSQPIDQFIIPFSNTTYQTQHTVIRATIKQQCAARLSVSESTICIYKNESCVPIVLVKDRLGSQLKLPLSISHHGHYGAYVVELPTTTSTI